MMKPISFDENRERLRYYFCDLRKLCVKKILRLHPERVTDIGEKKRIHDLVDELLHIKTLLDGDEE